MAWASASGSRVPKLLGFQLQGFRDLLGLWPGYRDWAQHATREYAEAQALQYYMSTEPLPGESEEFS